MSYYDSIPALQKRLKEIDPLRGIPEYEFLIERAKECLAFNMSPEYWDNMTVLEHHAWIRAYNEQQNERSA